LRNVANEAIRETTESLPNDERKSTMKYKLIVLVSLLIPTATHAQESPTPAVSAVRSQYQLPEPKKIMGLYNEESSWSPNGKWIAFDSSRPGKTNIFTWNIETREQKRLTSGDANDITPEWSPDGKQIVFVSDRTGHNEIYVINSSGGEARQVTNDKSDNIHPHWSPDGQRIIYCSARDNTDQAYAPEGEVYEIYTIT
jgi:Tol biopolymer transport system component